MNNTVYYEQKQVAIDTRICLSNMYNADKWGDIICMA